MSLDVIRSTLGDRLPALLSRFQVPGAVLAVDAGGERFALAHGVLNTRTGVEATTDALFQVGSITKVWTTTLIMQLADEGLLELDTPVRHYLPELRLGDPDAAETVTVRQLLCHTGGFEGDLFTDTGRGDDCVARFVATLGDTPQLFPPGTMLSYNNAGFAVLGRVVEVLRGRPFDVCLRESLAVPLGVTAFATDAYEAILHRTAVGHIRPSADAPLAPAPVWSLPRSNAPAGSMLAMSAGDLLLFARMHLSGGAGLLSPDGVKAMQQRAADRPAPGMPGAGWGLGWEIMNDAGTVIGHDGGTIGQAAFLRVVPDRDVAAVLLTNGGDAVSLYLSLLPPLLRELTGIALPAPAEVPADPAPFDAARYLGVYSSRVAELTVSRDGDGRVWLHDAPKGIFTQLGPPAPAQELVHLTGDTLIVRDHPGLAHPVYAFLGDDGHGRSLYLHGGRATRRRAVRQP
ncbi:serine hydrolase domain-containing protein [Catenuloplanes atrovinosus]|uniref:CubicO group peptidase (Beta-lactamase class C family) n=1 Tax=Catenuloplanes atrovinosus TaxID=137266 RepID=A0AAE3YLL6_9ACTN|nr:serine hydrolase domain-containing protein [Catenuloplanes atrovinosus]MDR7274449.1 CubicO group peptidase (beta-lactamase class C family) [Catenuloplanes atrovinosus]